MPKRPNIVVILADDMGFADLGCTGSEIRTPTLDKLADDGLLLSAMYNCGRCCPTRASLLTGLYPQEAGIGHMGTNLGSPAYQGYLREDAVTIAEHLRAGGYKTLMSGKWHVGGDYPAREYDRWTPGTSDHPTPRQRGFDRFYGLLDGAAHFFAPHVMVEDAVAEDSPFFLYLAHTAPHWPLHAPHEDIARYDGVYDAGWDAMRTARHEEMNSLGLFQTNWDISPRDPQVLPW